MAAPDRSSGRDSAGAPQVAQNLPDPMSSAPHFKQLGIAGIFAWLRFSEQRSEFRR